MHVKNLIPVAAIFFFSFSLFSALPVSVKAENPSAIKIIIVKGDLRLQNGDAREAFNLYDQAFRITPDSVEVNFKLGLTATALKDYETAVMAFERVVMVDPDFVQAKIEMAKAFYYLGATETAKQYFTEALEADIPADVSNAITSFLAEIN